MERITATFCTALKALTGPFSSLFFNLSSCSSPSTKSTVPRTTCKTNQWLEIKNRMSRELTSPRRKLKSKINLPTFHSSRRLISTKFPNQFLTSSLTLNSNTKEIKSWKTNRTQMSSKRSKFNNFKVDQDQ